MVSARSRILNATTSALPSSWLSNCVYFVGLRVVEGVGFWGLGLAFKVKSRDLRLMLYKGPLNFSLKLRVCVSWSRGQGS